jgi:sec-independent protein translocase protein TatB
MFDIAWSELMLISVVALVVIGPKDLPKAIYALGKWVRKARVVAREFQTHVDDMMRETELDELRREALKTRDMNIKKMMEDTIDPQGEVSKAFDVGLTGHAGSPVDESAVAEPVTSPAVDPVAIETVTEPLAQPPAQPPVTAATPVIPHPTDKQA